jgi:hypothetical protein
VNLMPANAWEAQQMYSSAVDTARLVGLALSLPVDRESGRNELYGRDRVYCAIADTQEAAIEHIVRLARDDGWFADRRLACDSLAVAGWSAGSVIEEAGKL